MKPQPFDDPTIVATPMHGVPVVGAQQQVVQAVGRWSNVDVYIDAPAGWWQDGAATPMTFRLHAILRQRRYLVAQVASNVTTLSPEGLTPPLRYTSLVLSVRGHPCDGFVLEADGNASSDTQRGHVWLRLWGDQSSPEAVNEPLSDAMVNPVQPVPIRAAFGMLWDPAASRWRRAIGTGGVPVVSVTAPLEPSQKVRDATLNKLKNTAQGGWLYGFTVRIDPTAPTSRLYVQTFDSVAAPVAGEGIATMVVGPIPVNHTNGATTDDYVSFDLPQPYFVTNTLWIALSTSWAVLTYAGDFMQLIEARIHA